MYNDALIFLASALHNWLSHVVSCPGPSRNFHAKIIVILYLDACSPDPTEELSANRICTQNCSSYAPIFLAGVAPIAWSSRAPDIFNKSICIYRTRLEEEVKLLLQERCCLSDLITVASTKSRACNRPHACATIVCITV